MSVQQPGGGGSTVTITGSLPAGANDIGSVDQHGAPWSVSQSGSPWGVNPSGETAGVGVGAAADAAAAGNGSLIGITKQTRVLLAGGLPAALGAGGGLKVDGSGTALPVSGTVTVGTMAALVAGTALVGKVGAFLGLGQVIDSTGVARTVTSTFVNVAASQTDSSIVAISGSTVVYVLAIAMVTGGTATNVTFNSKPAGAGAAISPLFANAANGGAVLPFMGTPWFQSTAAQGLSVTTGAGSTTGILVLYAQF